MLIDNTDIKSFNAILMNKIIQPASVENSYEWLSKALLPSFLSQKFTFVAIEVQLYVKGLNESDVKSKVSAIISKSKDCIINFNDDFYYKSILSGTQIENTLKKETRKLILSFVAYCYKSEVIELANRISSKTINAPGTLESPVIVEITPSVNLAEFIVTGLGETFKIKNLLSGQKVIVNGEDCTVLQGTTNKFSDYDSWDFPIISPGAKTITFSSIGCDVSIKYKPRWI